MEQARKVRTVLGDVSPASLGRTLTHEHLLYSYPGAELDHRCAFDLASTTERISTELAAAVRDLGFKTLVDMTPAEVGRHPQLMADVSRRSGANIVGTTGFFPEHLGFPYWWRLQSVEEFAEFFTRDITEGMVFAGTQTSIRAGIIKIATGMDSVNPRPSPIGPNGRRITECEDRAIRGAGRAQKGVGCAVNTHTDPTDYSVGNPGLEQLDVLEEEGADPSKVIIGHAFIHGTTEQIKAICDRGATVQVDHMGIPWRHDNIGELDAKLARQTCELADSGYLDRMVITYDRWFFNPRGASTDLNPQLSNEKVPLNYLYTDFLPRLKTLGFREPDLDRMLIDNPQRLLAF
jgi:phosphotriesterase-related protein